MAWERNDFWGMLSIIVGVTLGFLAFLKMRSGQMNKSINKEDNTNNDI